MINGPAAFTAVVNPTAGHGGAPRAAAELAAAMPAGSVEVVPSTSGAHAREVAAAACAGGRAVLAVGGDGHAAGIACAVVAAGGVMGIVPAGRGNDFARQLGLSGDPAACAELFRAGHTRTIDVLEADGRVVLGSVYAGVDSAVNVFVNSRMRFLPAVVAYRYSTVRTLLTFEPVGYRLVLDGQEWAERGFSVVVANSGWYGAGMHMVPTAEPDDGWIDVLLVRASSRMSLIAALRQVPSGSHTGRPDVEVRRAREVVFGADRPVPVCGDGEPLGVLPTTVTVRPSALRVLSR